MMKTKTDEATFSLMKTKTGQKCFAFAGGRLYNEVPLDTRMTESRIVFKSFLNEHFS